MIGKQIKMRLSNFDDRERYRNGQHVEVIIDIAVCVSTSARRLSYSSCEGYTHFDLENKRTGVEDGDSIGADLCFGIPGDDDDDKIQAVRCDCVSGIAGV